MAEQQASSSPGTPKTDKGSSSDNTDKPTQDVQITLPPRPQSALDKPRTPRSPVVMPKSILRVSSPDGYRRPRQFVSPETGEPLSPDLTPLSSDSSAITPLNRPTSPGVRFAKATIHHVEVGPGRRFLPVRRKSKSTVTYIGPHDPVAQPAVPKTLLQSPTKMRRHQENQAAMGRYWMRTEEEEAELRKEAERRAQEEAERYRNEPASPLPLSAILTTATTERSLDKEGDTEMQSGLAAKLMETEKLPSRDGDAPLDKLEEVDSEDEDGETGGKVTPERAPAKGGDGTPTEKSEEADVSTASSSAQSAAQTSQNGASGTSTAAAPTALEVGSGVTKSAEHRSFAVRFAEKQAAEEPARAAPVSPTPTRTEPQPSSTHKSSSSSSDSALPKAKDKGRDSKDTATASSSGRPTNTNTTQQATTVTTTTTTTTTTTLKTSSLSSSRHRMGDRDRSSRDKEKAKEKSRAFSAMTTAKSTPNLRSSYFLFSGTSRYHHALRDSDSKYRIRAQDYHPSRSNNNFFFQLDNPPPPPSPQPQRRQRQLPFAQDTTLL
ncbi:hypothetical protein VTJ49DRAFT_2634 [Mycothermus thermophilus]|uniref:Uncharacterized protein n=1 Tax=Humicola insolens TaxID=85995 RepID=A0ABR3VAJ9_HUMIN